MREFKPGDKLVCIDVDNMAHVPDRPVLKFGAVYTVSSVYESDKSQVCIEETVWMSSGINQGKAVPWFKNRFRHLDQVT